MIKRIAHHTRGEARPLTPVQEKALSGSAMSVAPRFRRNSDTNTQATLKPSCSHGLPKPEGRPRIGFSSPWQCYGNRFRISALCGRARHSVRAARSACRGLPALPNAKQTWPGFKAHPHSEIVAKLDRAWLVPDI